LVIYDRPDYGPELSIKLKLLESIYPRQFLELEPAAVIKIDLHLGYIN
jgi:hypothetical protein